VLILTPLGYMASFRMDEHCAVRISLKQECICCYYEVGLNKPKCIHSDREISKKLSVSAHFLSIDELRKASAGVYLFINSCKQRLTIKVI